MSPSRSFPTADKDPRRSRHRWLIAGTLVVVCLLVGVLFDPLTFLRDAAAAARLRWELPRASERWQSQGLTDYRIHVKGAVPLLCLIDGELTIRNGLLAEVRMRQNPFVPDAPLGLVPRSDWGQQGCPLEELTIERMFERVETALRAAGPVGGPVSVSFDPEKGYITEYRWGRPSQGGLLGSTQSECCTWFEFDELRTASP